MQREARADRAHERQMRFLENRSAAYLVLMEYVGRVVTMVDAWAEGRPTPEALEGVWQGDEWQVAMAQFRTYGSKNVMTAFMAFIETAQRLPALPVAPKEGRDGVRALAEQLLDAVQAEIHPPDLAEGGD